jgi:uncharacterized repeat protein (TIGR01451 family)
MKARSCYGSNKIRLILTLLIGVLSVSAITFGDTILAPIGFAHEGSSVAKLDPTVQVVGNPTRLRPGKLPGLTSPSMFAFQTTIDDSGADDEPGQKDLSLMAVDFGAAGSPFFRVIWQWDNTATTGNNTRDAGALFDTDGDGNANYSLYITVNTNGTFVTQLYVCGADSRADRCGGPALDNTFDSTAEIFINGVDPFGPNGIAPTASHSVGNTCIGRPGCYSLDTAADVHAVLADFGNPADIKLLNVCSYPSGEPNSDPSDCVVEQAPGYLTLVKVVNKYNEVTPGLLGVSDFPLTINGNSATSGVEVSAPAGTYTIGETSQTGYSIGRWECSNGTNGTAGSATASVTIASGDDVTCTMTNTLIANPAISLDKTASTANFSNPPVPGNKITYTFVITNTGNVTLSGVDLDDTLLGYSNVTCGTATLAPGASTNCTADYTLTQANIDAETVSNTATACGDPPAGAGNEVCSSDGTTTTILVTRTLSLVKTAIIKTITYSFVITNTGNTTLSTVALSDSKLGNVTGCDKASLAPGATSVCSADYTVTQADLAAGFVTNTATATATGGVTTQTSVTVTPLTVVSPTPTP